MKLRVVIACTLLLRLSQVTLLLLERSTCCLAVLIVHLALFSFSCFHFCPMVFQFCDFPGFVFTPIHQACSLRPTQESQPPRSIPSNPMLVFTPPRRFCVLRSDTISPPSLRVLSSVFSRPSPCLSSTQRLARTYRRRCRCPSSTYSSREDRRSTGSSSQLLCSPPRGTR